MYMYIYKYIHIYVYKYTSVYIYIYIYIYIIHSVHDYAWFALTCCINKKRHFNKKH